VSCRERSFSIRWADANAARPRGSEVDDQSGITACGELGNAGLPETGRHATGASFGVFVRTLGCVPVVRGAVAQDTGAPMVPEKHGSDEPRAAG